MTFSLVSFGGVFPVDKPGRFCIFFNNTIHYTIFQSIGPIQYNTNTIQYLKELYPIRNNILIHLIKILLYIGYNFSRYCIVLVLYCIGPIFITRPDTRQSSRGRLGRSTVILEIFRTDGWTD